LTFFVLAIMWLPAVACSSVKSPEELPTATDVDLSRYVGLWHEIARLPMWAQRNCVRSTAEYWSIESDKIGVRNRCITPKGEAKGIEGVATVVDSEHRARLNVVFDQWAAKLWAFVSPSTRGNYWILWVDSDYHLAIVGTPDRDYLWILARTPTLDESSYQNAVTFSHRLGFPTDKLVRAPAPED
jgi:apolipoprotein D and lipocalin family protein